MEIVLLASGLFFLFLLLGLSADLTINNVRVLGQRLEIAPFALGLILGILTSLPELFIGINAVLQNIPQISFGNLMGGIVVLLGLIGGTLIIVEKTIVTRNLFTGKQLVLMGGFIVLPMVLAMDRVISVGDGLLLSVSYILIVNFLLGHRTHEQNSQALNELKSNHTTRRAISLGLMGIIGIVAVSHFIISTTLRLVDILHLPLFFTGLVVFSLGTNLPELTVAFASWRKGVKRLGLGNILGSAFTNALVVGFLGLLQPFPLRTSLSFWIFLGILILTVALFVLFAITGRKFTRGEGIILVVLYVVFLFSELACLGFSNTDFCVR